MKIKNSILFICLLSFNCAINSFWFKTNSTESLNDQFNRYLTELQSDKLTTAAYWSLLPILVSTTYYVHDTYCKNAQVATKYENAQKWYEAIDQKYPEAHLHQKQFLQAEYTQEPSFYNIYYSHDSLKQIEKLYTKKLNNQTLTNDEQIILQQKEFLLLYQAGYIERNCAMYSNLTKLACFAGTEAIQIPILKLFNSPSHINTLYDLQDQMNQMQYQHTMLSIADLVFYLSVLMPCITQYYENVAYEFAYTQCDTNCLHAAVELFEYDKTKTSLLLNIKNEITRRQAR